MRLAVMLGSVLWALAAHAQTAPAPCMWPWAEAQLAWDAAAGATGYEVHASSTGLVATVTEPRATVPCRQAEQTWQVIATGDAGQRVAGPVSDPVRCLGMRAGKPITMTELEPALIAFRERYPTCEGKP